MAIAGLGVVTTFTSPAAGANFTTSVPSGKAWRIWGGSFRFVASATVASRAPTLTFRQGSTAFYLAASEFNITASQTWKVCLYQLGLYFNNVYYSTWYPIGIKAIWLPAATTVNFEVLSIQAADQIDQVTMLIEEVTA